MNNAPMQTACPHALVAGAAPLWALSLVALTLAPVQGTAAASAPTSFVEVTGYKLAYRVVGTDNSFVLSHRILGVLDPWDPAFIDPLATQGFQVTTFDHSGWPLAGPEVTCAPSDIGRFMRRFVPEKAFEKSFCTEISSPA